MHILTAEAIARLKTLDRGKRFILEALSAICLDFAAGKSDEKLPHCGGNRRTPFSSSDPGAPVSLFVD